ncbi:MAG: TetR/AcrR family transcriptional regulator [Mycobacteriales bacterium]
MTAGRRYAGRTTPERQEDRRYRLLAAGLELFGTLGWAAGTVERLCAEAGVATRSFYEEFDGREDLLLAVYAQVLDGAAAAVRAAVAAAPLELLARTRAGLAAYVEYLVADPRRARVAHVEVRAAGGSLEPERRAAVVGFAHLIDGQGRQLVGAGQCRPDATPLTALALAGAVNELLVNWATTQPHPPTGPLVGELVGLFVAALRVG